MITVFRNYADTKEFNGEKLLIQLLKKFFFSYNYVDVLKHKKKH